MRHLGYIYNSTNKHHQVISLNRVCDAVFIEDSVSSIKKSRPVYEKLIKKLQPGDMLVVYSLDRAFRSVLDALSELEKLHKRNIQFKSLTQNFDTTTSEGKLLYNMAAALAEWERQTLSERIKDGLSAARQRGSILGRPVKLRKADILSARDILNSDPLKTITGLAKEFNVTPRSLMRAINRL